MCSTVDNTHEDFTNPTLLLVPLLSPSEVGCARSRRGPNHPLKLKLRHHIQRPTGLRKLYARYMAADELASQQGGHSASLMAEG